MSTTNSGAGDAGPLHDLRRHVLSLLTAGALPASVATSLLATLDSACAGADADAAADASDSSAEESTSDRVPCGPVVRGSGAPSRRRAPPAAPPTPPPARAAPGPPRGPTAG